jgi:hypothetical protein
LVIFSEVKGLNEESKFLYGRMKELWDHTNNLVRKAEYTSEQMQLLMSHPTTPAAINTQISQVMATNSDLGRQVSEIE